MAQPDLLELIAQRIEEEIEIPVIVETEAGAILLSGRVTTSEEREAASDVAAALAPGWRIENNLEVEDIAIDEEPDIHVAPRDLNDLGIAADDELDQLEPCFIDRPVTTDVIRVIAEADDTFFPPTDPVVRGDPQSRDGIEVIGGTQPTAMDDVEVERSALDSQPGDEALIDAVKRELREDATTTDLEIQVVVRNGVAYLRGTVSDVQDVENAEAVAARVPGIREVVERITVRPEA